MPDLVTITTDGGKRFTVAREQAERFRGLLNDIERRMPITEDSGGYADRNIAGTDRLSKHASGMAVDVNWNSNPEGKRATAITGAFEPDELRRLQKLHGLEWGGKWNRPFKGPDNMHWEVPAGAEAVPIGSPSVSLPLDAVPESGLPQLSLLQSSGNSGNVPPRTPFVAQATPAPTPSPSPQAGRGEQPQAPTAMDLSSLKESAPLFKAAAAPFAAEKKAPPVADNAHEGAHQGAQRVALEWMAKRRAASPLLGGKA